MDLLLISVVFLILLGLVFISYLVYGIAGNKEIEQNTAGHLTLFSILKWKLVLMIPITLVVIMALYKGWVFKQGQSQSVVQLHEKIKTSYDSTLNWQAPDPSLILLDPNKELILYGRQLISRTSDFLGPKGVIKPMSNGMNCQNCHLEAGTKVFGNNYSGVLANYPKFRARSGTEETISKRINDCIQRSLNGDSLDNNSREMKAMTAYIHWVGQAVPKNTTPKGVGLMKLKSLNRPADAIQGKSVYMLKCQSCHGADGSGLPRPDDPGTFYPPLWGDHSYNEAAGLFRLSAFAGYVKANMPFGTNSDAPQLTDEEAWDLAAFVNSQSRPKHKFLHIDWPNISKKPYDHPFGPYSDSFPVAQHKYGPFQPIIQYQTSQVK